MDDISQNCSFVLIDPDSTQQLEGKWRLPTIYKAGKDGKQSFWQIGFNGEELVVQYGNVGSEKYQTQHVEVKVNKSGRNRQQQAFLEAHRRYTDKCRKTGYATEIGTSFRPDPMLGVLWVPLERREKGKKYAEIKSWPVLCQPKLDGVRSMAAFVDSEVRFRSRQNLKWRSFPHLEDEVAMLLAMLPNYELDGELYCHGMPFATISSITRLQKTTHPDEHKLQYHIFDMRPIENVEMPFEQRHAELKRAFDAGQWERLVLVPVAEAADSATIVSLHQKWRNDGYEGTVIRYMGADNPLARYVGGRYGHMLKFKDDLDEEGEIVGFKEGRGREAGAILFRVRAPNGTEFWVRMMGTLEERKAMYGRAKSYLGKRLTYSYHGIGSKGAPRDPVGKAIRDYE